VRRRLTRSQQRERTRERLLVATVEVVAKRGVHEASLTEIAERAGYTIGAVYHYFGGKEQLLAEAFRKGVSEYAARFQAVLREQPDAKGRNLAAASLFSELFEGRQTMLLYLEYVLYAVRHSTLLAGLRDASEELAAVCAGWLESTAAERSLPRPPRGHAIAVNALTNGFGLARLIDPSQATSERYGEALAALVGARLDVDVKRPALA
jgi:AcrR family transcriptional regulator